jgi:hypothetical protein
MITNQKKKKKRRKERKEERKRRKERKERVGFGMCFCVSQEKKKKDI